MGLDKNYVLQQSISYLCQFPLMRMDLAPCLHTLDGVACSPINKRKFCLLHISATLKIKMVKKWWFLANCNWLMNFWISPRYFMTDRTENHRVFNDFKILAIASLSVIVNYAFVIGILIPLVIEDICDLEQRLRCFKTNDNNVTWTLILFAIYYSVVTSSGICADLALHRYVSKVCNYL